MQHQAVAFRQTAASDATALSIALGHRSHLVEDMAARASRLPLAAAALVLAEREVGKSWQLQHAVIWSTRRQTASALGSWCWAVFTR